MTLNAPILVGNYTIRQFSPSTDLQKVIRVNKSTLPENYYDSFFLLTYSSFPEGFLVCEDEQKEIVAYTMNRIETGLSNFSRLKRVKKGHVISIAVMAHARRNKIGRKLMELALEEMRNGDAAECFLEVRCSNDPAINMYESLGFEKIKILKKYYSDEESAYLMATRL